MNSLRARWLLIAAAALAALAGFWLAHQLDRGSPQLASGTWLPHAKAVGEFALTDSAGHSFARQRLDGAPTLVFFGFTHCPDVCPTTLLLLAQVRKRASIAHLRVLFISIDPQRDTPAALAPYVHAFDPSFEGLTGDPPVIAQLAANFGVAVNRVELPGGDYTMDHSAVVFLLNSAGNIAAIFTPPFNAASFSADLDRAAPYLEVAGSPRAT
jgi:protein SCO1